MATKEEKPKPKQTPEQMLLAKKLAAAAAIMKKYGASEANPAGGRLASDLRELKVQPTGIDTLDNEVFGVGGLPKGRLVELYGIESSGKTALALFLMGKVQAYNPTAIVKFYDAEHSWTDPWAASMGIVPERTLLPEFWGAENMGSQIFADLASEFPPDIIVIDSLAVLQPEGLMIKDVADHTMKDNLARADYLTKFFNRLTDGFYYPASGKDGKIPAGAKHIKLSQTETTVICINHAKQRTVKSGSNTYTEWYTVGGVSVNFHAAMRLMVRRAGFEESGGITTHQKINVKADKNKVAPPRRSCELLLDFKGGLQQVGIVNYLRKAMERGLATAKGGWIHSALLPDGKIQGKDHFNKYIEENDVAKKAVIG